MFLNISNFGSGQHEIVVVRVGIGRVDENLPCLVLVKAERSINGR